MVINLRVWFDDPLAPHQIVSWVLLLLAVLLAGVGFLQLHQFGRPEGSFENTTKLVETGLYRFIRHPLYISLILGTWGIALKKLDSLSVITVLAATICYFFTAKVEEEEMIEKFGEEYKDYMGARSCSSRSSSDDASPPNFIHRVVVTYFPISMLDTAMYNCDEINATTQA